MTLLCEKVRVRYPDPFPTANQGKGEKGVLGYPALLSIALLSICLSCLRLRFVWFLLTSPIHM